MSEASEKTKENTSETTGVIKTAIEAIKTAKEALDPAKESRPGPLVVVARFYLSLMVLMAAASSAAAIIDFEAGHEPSSTVADLRWFLMFAVGLGLLLGVGLIWLLLRRHVLYLFNPAELSETQQALLPRTKEQVEKATAPAGQGEPPKTMQGPQHGKL